jgi:hypothetical protein
LSNQDVYKLSILQRFKAGNGKRHKILFYLKALSTSILSLLKKGGKDAAM